MTKCDLYIEGYPDIETILQHFNSFHILIEHARRTDMGRITLQKWDKERNKKLKNPPNIIIEFNRENVSGWDIRFDDGDE